MVAARVAAGGDHQRLHRRACDDDPAALAQGAYGALLRQSAQIALMHAMGMIASATFMKMGASAAARVPVFFVAGTLFYSVPVYFA